MHMRIGTMLTAAAALLAASLASPANADIIFQEGNHPQADEQNVLFGASEVGIQLANGEVGHTGAAVQFTTLGNPLQVITQQAKGQADIFCALNCINNGGNQDQQLGSISMRAGLSANGIQTAWTDAIINLDFGTGTANVRVFDNFGEDFQYELGPGSNFLTMVAVPGSGEFITRIDVTNADPGAAFGFNSFKQPRVSGLCELVNGGCETIETPEPASLLLLGSSLIGLWGGIKLRRRSRRDDDPGRSAIA
jgi:hypothetical protein